MYLEPPAMIWDDGAYGDPGKSQGERKELKKTNLILEGGKVLNVYSGEILESAVAIKGEKIWYVGPRRPREEEG